MKIQVKIYGLILGIMIEALLFLFACTSLAEKEYQAMLMGFAAFLAALIVMLTFIILNRRGKLDQGVPAAVLRALLIITTVFIAVLFVPTQGTQVRETSCGTTDVSGTQKRLDASTQPGSSLIKRMSSCIKEDVLTLTIYDVCVGKVSHRVHRDGPVNPDRVEVVDPQVLTGKVKDDAMSLGAQVVGIAELKPQYTFTHDIEGRPINLKHRYAIVLGVGLNYRLASPSAPLPYEDSYSAIPEELAAAISGEKVRSNFKIPDDVVEDVKETMRFFSEGGASAVQLAAYIRKLGYPARAHFHRWGEVQIVPLAIEAGLGELGKNGMLINGTFGPRGSFSVVTTDLPLVPDKPVDLGIQEFCRVCNKCARTCPVQAIPYGGPHNVNGVVKWPLDGKKCWDYIVKNPKCMACIASCPYNKQDYLVHRMAVYMISRKSIITNYIIARLDDRLGYAKYLKDYSKNGGNGK